jgi:hypothetical protein
MLCDRFRVYASMEVELHVIPTVCSGFQNRRMIAGKIESGGWVVWPKHSSSMTA